MQRRNLLKLAAAGTAALAMSAGPTLLITGCDTSWITTAVDDIPTISSIIGSVLSIVALGNPALTPDIAAAVNLGLNAAAAALVTVQSLITSYKASSDSSVLTKIDAALTDVQTNLSAVLSAAHIKDTALQATIASGISIAISVVSAIQLLIPETVAAAHDSALAVGVSRVRAKNSIPQKINVTNSNTLKLMYNVVAASCGYSANLVK